MSYESKKIESGWPRLFWQAFSQSRNAMVLLDDQRRHVEVNDAYVELLGYKRAALLGRPIWEVEAGGPLLSPRQWQEVLHRSQFTGITDLVCADRRRVAVEFAGHPEIVTGRRLVLFVALRTGRPAVVPGPEATPAKASVPLTAREKEVVKLVALGLSGPKIAGELHLTHNTVRTHIRNAMSKLGARTRAQLVAKSLSEGSYWHEPDKS